jgi:hypothetical protein
MESIFSPGWKAIAGAGWSRCLTSIMPGSLACITHSFAIFTDEYAGIGQILKASFLEEKFTFTFERKDQ